MARYIDADKAKSELLGWETDPTDDEIEYAIDNIPTEDVVPKSEVERLERIIETQREAICSECRKYHRLLDDCSWSLNSDPEPNCRGCEWNTAKG